MFLKVSLEVALLTAAISSDSTSAHPGSGMLSPRALRSSMTIAIASSTIDRAWQGLPEGNDSWLSRLWIWPECHAFRIFPLHGRVVVTLLSNP